MYVFSHIYGQEWPQSAFNIIKQMLSPNWKEFYLNNYPASCYRGVYASSYF